MWKNTQTPFLRENVAKINHTCKKKKKQGNYILSDLLVNEKETGHAHLKENKG
jgi:hypothetical protein